MPNSEAEDTPTPEIDEVERRKQLETGHQPVERLLGPSRRNEPTGLIFDWEFLSLTNPKLLTFIGEVHWPTYKNKFRFQIDLAKLPAERNADLERLSNILSARHAGIDDRPSLLHSIEWMWTISLGQTMPELSLAERQLQARRLLGSPEPEKSDTPLVIGINPLLPWISPPVRKRFWKKHRIDIGELERESIQLRVGLEQFKKVFSEPDFQERIDDYIKRLIDFHRRVKEAGGLLGGRLGEALVILADLAIEQLLKSRSE